MVCKIFNWHNLRVSFSSALKLRKSFVDKPTHETEKGCSCNGNIICPMNDHCNTEPIIYEAEVTTIKQNGQPNLQNTRGQMKVLSEPARIISSRPLTSWRNF